MPRTKKLGRGPYKRRSVEEKKELVRAYDALKKRGARTKFLRRKKLTTSHITCWRRALCS